MLLLLLFNIHDWHTCYIYIILACSDLGESQDSGLGGSATDVIVFGTGVNNEQEASQRG